MSPSRHPLGRWTRVSLISIGGPKRPGPVCCRTRDVPSGLAYARSSHRGVAGAVQRSGGCERGRQHVHARSERNVSVPVSVSRQRRLGVLTPPKQQGCRRRCGWHRHSLSVQAPRRSVKRHVTSTPDRRISARRAVAIGHLVVNVPGLVVIAGVGVATMGHPSGSSFALILGAGAVAWLWWAFTVPRWRRWATTRGADPTALQRTGERTGLIWPEGSWMSRTEFRSRRS